MPNWRMHLARPPEPVDGKNATEAEERLKRLNQRFRSVSLRLDGSARRNGGWGLTGFELVILLGLIGFVGWAALQVV